VNACSVLGVDTRGGGSSFGTVAGPQSLPLLSGGDPRDERTGTMELHIRASDLAKVKHCMQANQPVTVTGLNGAGIIEVVSGLVCAIEPDPNRSAEYPFRVVVLPRGRAKLTVVNSDTG
jgi:hypothetical protein